MYEANEKFQRFSFFTLDTSQSFQFPPPHLLVSFITYPQNTFKVIYYTWFNVLISNKFGISLRQGRVILHYILLNPHFLSHIHDTDLQLWERHI